MAECDPVKLMHHFMRALVAFNHDFQDVHNKLVISGMDRVLVECLDAAVRDPKRIEAIEPICQLLLMLYRCGDEQFQDSIAIVGGDLFPPLLASVFIKDWKDKQCPSAMALMERMNQIELGLRDVPWSHSLLEIFREVIDNVDPTSHVEPLSFIMTWLVEGLLLRTKTNKHYLMNHPGIFDSIVTKFAETFRPGCPVNLNLSRFTRILSEAPANRSIMVQRSEFLRLVFLLYHDNCVNTKIEVFKTLALVALDQTGRAKVFAFLDHKFIDISIQTLDNPDLASCSLTFLNVIALHISGKVILSKRPALLTDLAKHANLEAGHSILAAAAIGQLSKTLSVNSRTEECGLLDTVLQLCSAKDHRVRLIGACTLLDQVQNRPACGFFLVHVPEATDALATMAKDDNTDVRAMAAMVLAKLASSPLNIQAIARNKLLLGALAETAIRPSAHSKDTAAQQHAVFAILRLVMRQRPIETVAKQ